MCSIFITISYELVTKVVYVIHLNSKGGPYDSLLINGVKATKDYTLGVFEKLSFVSAMLGTFSVNVIFLSTYL